MDQGGGDPLLSEDPEFPENPPRESENPARRSPQTPGESDGVQDVNVNVPAAPEGENQRVGNGAPSAQSTAIKLMLLGIIIAASILNVLSFVLPGAFLKNAMKHSRTYPIWIFSTVNDIVWLTLLSIKMEQGGKGELLLHELQLAAFVFHYSYMIVQLSVPPVVVAAGTVILHLVCKGAHLVYKHYDPNVKGQIKVAEYAAIATSILSSLGPFAWFFIFFKTAPKLNPTLLTLGMAANFLWAIISGVDEDWNMLYANCAALLCALLLLHFT